MKNLLFIAMVSILGVLITSGCAYGVRYDGPYSGRIIDADSGEPIEGVVVLGEWSKEITTPGGAVHEFYDARETVTDKNGEFSIPGMGLEIMSNVTPMDVLIFKAGYEHIGMGPWSGLKSVGWKGEYEESYDPIKKIKVKKRLYDLKKKVKWERDKAIIPLRRWTLEERRNRFGSYYVDIPNEKKKLLLKEIEKEDREIGR